MNCKHCGAVVAEGAKFCENCGNKIEIESASVADQIKNEAFKEPERVDAEVVSEGTKMAQPETEAETTNSTLGDQFSQNTQNAESTASASVLVDEPQGPIGYSIASLVCGILGLLCCCCGFFGLIVSAAGIVLGIVSIKKNCEGKGMAIAGIVCGGIGALMTLGGIIIGGLTGGLANNLNDLGDFGDSLGDLLESL